MCPYLIDNDNRKSAPPALTSGQIFLLNWLAIEDGRVGECRGADLRALRDLGFVRYFGHDDQATVKLTKAGRRWLRFVDTHPAALD